MVGWGGGGGGGLLLDFRLPGRQPPTRHFETEGDFSCYHQHRHRDSLRPRGALRMRTAVEGSTHPRAEQKCTYMLLIVNQVRTCRCAVNQVTCILPREYHNLKQISSLYWFSVQTQQQRQSLSLLNLNLAFLPPSPRSRRCSPRPLRTPAQACRSCSRPPEKPGSRRDGVSPLVTTCRHLSRGVTTCLLS